MKHIPKKKWLGCAVASAAMLADLSYDEVEAHWPDLSDARLRGPQEFCDLLDSVTETRWCLRQCSHPLEPLSRFPFPGWPVAVFIQDSPWNPHFAQWIVVKGEIVHDPGRSSLDIVRRYPFRQWLVGWIAQPYRPAELSRNRIGCRFRELLGRPDVPGIFDFPQCEKARWANPETAEGKPDAE